uniref:ATP synthase subunit 4 n=2 Tax=Ulva TaxID=3118 RepID=A0A0U2HZZ3_9CHLO|nr:ATP synthase subunit 4 [Ulva fasciata]QBR54771.1 ATP synthase subunit 4 [Ulva lactuca]WVH39676.1 ATP synthase subunit 4 [Ulva dactylifera]BBE20940.1 ATP synthase subunit 4 [Ulva ohnoi]ALG35705.1 ATP synthase subunit 4 [Ulva fasciata]AML79981.1 ATP synthase subunit 4 [Ulva fasciata]
MSLNLTIYYIIALITLSGLGIVFLNSESILAICFFIFVSLIVQNDPVSASLEEQKQSIRSELISCMIHGSTDQINLQKLVCYKKIQLLASLEYIMLTNK